MTSGLTGMFNPGTQLICVPALFAPQHRHRGY
jgi:hypothetical protein